MGIETLASTQKAYFQALYLAPFPGFDPAFLEVLDGWSRQQLLLQADGDEVAL